jgi:hypothetical protein
MQVALSRQQKLLLMPLWYEWTVMHRSMAARQTENLEDQSALGQLPSALGAATICSSWLAILDSSKQTLRQPCALFALHLLVYHAFRGLRCHPLTCMLLKLRLNVDLSPTALAKSFQLLVILQQRSRAATVRGKMYGVFYADVRIFSTRSHAVFVKE